MLCHLTGKSLMTKPFYVWIHISMTWLHRCATGYSVYSYVFADELSDACRLISRKIGPSWRGLYQHLPFLPRRDRNRKEHDINLVYVTCLHRDQTLTEQAWQSLVKWRALNRQRRTENNMAYLVKALKRVDKYNLARLVESKYVKAQSIWNTHQLYIYISNNLYIIIINKYIRKQL